MYPLLGVPDSSYIAVHAIFKRLMWNMNIGSTVFRTTGAAALVDFAATVRIQRHDVVTAEQVVVDLELGVRVIDAPGV